MKFIAAVCLLAFAGCQSPTNKPLAAAPAVRDTVVPVAKVVSPPDTTTLGGVWYLQAMLPSDTAAGKIPTLILDVHKSRFSGNTGCNSMHGEFWFSRTDSSLSFGEKIIATRMACPGYNEAAFMKSLRSAGRYRLRNGVLILLSDNNTELSHWIRKQSAGPKALKA